LQERLARGDQGINELDRACLEHDVAYENPDLDTRHAADRILRGKAWARVKSKNASFSERAWALLTAAAMAGKLAIGAGLKRRKKTTTKRKPLKQKRRKVSKKAKKPKRRVVKSKQKRELPLPKKIGGIIPVVLGVLGALSGLASGAASIASAVNADKNKKRLLAEETRHHKALENLASQKNA
jgi:hypothetical protein